MKVLHQTFICLLLLGATTNAAGINRSVDLAISELPLDVLLDGDTSSRAKYLALCALERNPDYAWSQVPRLISAVRSLNADRRARADWVLWCVFGPKAQVSIALEISARTYRRAADPREWGGLAQAAHERRLVAWAFDNLARTWPPLDFRLMILDELAGISVRAAPWRAELPLIAQELMSREWYPVRFLLHAMDDPDEQVRAAAELLSRSLTQDGALVPHAARSVVAVALRDSGRVGARAAELLKTAKGKARARAVGRALLARAAAEPKAAEVLLILNESKSPAAQMAQQVSALPPHVRPEFLRVFLYVTPGDTAAADVPLSRLVVSDDPLIRNSARAIAVMDRTIFTPERILSYIVARGTPPDDHLIRDLAPDPGKLGPMLLTPLNGQSESQRDAAFSLLRRLGSDAPEVREALQMQLRSDNERVRLTAADLLGDEQSRKIARAPGILLDLRSDDLRKRLVAAAAAHTLALDDPAVTSALLRAVKNKDMLAREGLVLALEIADVKQSKALDVLNDLAQSSTDPTTRAYAKAALREIAAAPK